MSAIEVHNLHKEFSYYRKNSGLLGSVKNMFRRETLIREAVKDVSFQVQKGEMKGLLGPNGAGKTTTLKMLAGILYPTSGTAQVAGYIPWERKNAFKRHFSIVMGQKNQLWWDLPAMDSFYLNKCIYDVDDCTYQSVIGELTELLDVKEQVNIQVRRLSLGERMKMELIAALIHRPEILFLDEPTIGLDLISQKKIRDFLKYYNEQTKTTIILTSHYMQDIEELCRDVVIINSGLVVYDGSLKHVNDIMGNKKRLSFQLAKQVPKEQLERYGHVCRAEDYEVTFEVERSQVNTCASLVLKELPVVDFNAADVPIEEGIAMFYEKAGGKTNDGE